MNQLEGGRRHQEGHCGKTTNGSEVESGVCVKMPSWKSHALHDNLKYHLKLCVCEREQECKCTRSSTVCDGQGLLTELHASSSQKN